MLAIFGKKKVTDDKVSLHFVHTTLEVVESGWPEVAGFINDSPEFIKRPNLDPDDFGRFLMIVIAGNLAFFKKYRNTLSTPTETTNEIFGIVKVLQELGRRSISIGSAGKKLVSSPRQAVT